ncbi:hypothetical protein HanXRQr2_Chr16g0733631 [Helianthus annuus]|uniref:Uncharacterized protein n=1 Tax=Helianthus annuus TaxID=4232 RepID=A0A9K3DNU6_HELAN|nr:hypothetical protein HanXRQr2_Chr16g0733631 [Helianthus annuus]KAJ0820091.1 hypothetical protein HanPSC8_Chr16g0703751 [Helianthus annuus]
MEDQMILILGSLITLRPCVVVKEDPWALSAMWRSSQQLGGGGIMGRFSKMGVVV